MKIWQKRPEQFAMPVELDCRYETVRMYIKAKRITKFREIFKHIPKTVVAIDMHTNGNRMTSMMQRPWEMTYEEGYFIAQLIGVDHKVLSAIIQRSMEERSGSAKIKSPGRNLGPDLNL